MATRSEQQTRPETARGLEFDTIVVGAGISGLYQLYRLREIGQQVVDDMISTDPVRPLTGTGIEAMQ